MSRYNLYDNFILVFVISELHPDEMIIKTINVIYILDANKNRSALIYLEMR